MENDIVRNLPVMVEAVKHRGEKRIKLVFSYNTELIAKVRQIPGARWSRTMKCWHVPYNESYMAEIMMIFNTSDKGQSLCKSLT